MKFTYLILLAAAYVLSACNSSPEPATTPPTPTAAPRATPFSDFIPKAVAELEKRAAVERELRVKAETRLAEQETATSHWQSGALLAVTAAIVLLIVGTCLGTQARHDAKS